MSNDPTTSPLWPADSPAVVAHMSLLQGVVNRLAGNSASCKTWCMTLVAALLSLAGAAHAPAIVGIALVPVAVFGYLDTMYLSQERAYRRHFENLAKKIRQKEYTLDDLFDADAPRNAGDFWHALGSWSIGPVYAGLALAYFVAHSLGYLAILAIPASAAK
ncbi:hypothetical protein SAMN05444679_10380 [Variovorax sp. CF079]|uniref:hypothetical protein n=1 Tax=Variovorax sp. CF079 TaxID=1882774 RepID=UPI00088189A9|nr:hypothetical protein [Variovorax sp. CF079]SDC44334.1 hypothetical protein SAMN05444679_10380 [Variovorax sp. CF079]